MQVLYERCAAVDVGKDVIAVAVRLPGGGPDGRATIKRTFRAFYGVLAEKVRWRRTRSWATSTDPEFAPKDLMRAARSRR